MAGMTGGKAYLVRSERPDGYDWTTDLYVYVKRESYSNSNNTSTISLGMYVYSPWNIDWGDTGHNGKSYIGIAKSGSGAHTFAKSRPSGNGKYWLVENVKFTVKHDANGRKTQRIYWHWGVNSPWGNYVGPSGYIDIQLGPLSVYDLSISAETGSSISVTRTSCVGSGSTGRMSAGSNKLYYGDKLKISFSHDNTHSIKTQTVNDIRFTSGNTYTVKGNVSVKTTSQKLVSVVTADDAYIGGKTSIRIKRYNSAYKHKLSYEFAGSTGTISGSSPISATSYEWDIPVDFYKILQDESAKCKIICDTIDGSKSLGKSYCTVVLSVRKKENLPGISMSIKDTNPATKRLTGDESIVILNKSDIECSIVATPKNWATIKTISVCGRTIRTISATQNTPFNLTYHFNKTQYGEYPVSTTDSRKFSSETVVVRPKSVVKYIQLTCSPKVFRESPSGNVMKMSFSGNSYNGSFGATDNEIEVWYRYKEGRTSSYNQWARVPAKNILLGGSSYMSVSDDASSTDIVLPGSYDYRKDYYFEIRAIDGVKGASGNISDPDGAMLSDIHSYVTVTRGIPQFDWGPDDFKFNVRTQFMGDVNMATPLSPTNGGTGSSAPIVTKVGLSGINSGSRGDEVTAYDCRYIEFMNIVFAKVYVGNLLISMKPGADRMVAKVADVKYSPGSMFALATRSGGGVSACIKSDGGIYIRALEAIPAGSQIALSGFWFV